MSSDQISPWFPVQDQIQLATLGKLIEECNELSARATRCILQGADQTDPDTGHTNLAELEKEAADVLACLEMARDVLGITPSGARVGKKLDGFQRWHALIAAGTVLGTSPPSPAGLNRARSEAMRRGDVAFDRADAIVRAYLGLSHEPG